MLYQLLQEKPKCVSQKESFAGGGFSWGNSNIVFLCSFVLLVDIFPFWNLRPPCGFPYLACFSNWDTMGAVNSSTFLSICVCVLHLFLLLLAIFYAWWRMSCIRMSYMNELHPFKCSVFPGIRNIAPLGVPMALCLGRPSVTVGARLPINHDPVQARGNSRLQPLVHLESINYTCN